MVRPANLIGDNFLSKKGESKARLKKKEIDNLINQAYKNASDIHELRLIESCERFLEINGYLTTSQARALKEIKVGPNKNAPPRGPFLPDSEE